MAKLSMQIKAKDMNSGKTVTTSLANVNPEASDSDKLQTAIAMNALTSNLYSSTDLIKTINLDTETEAGKQTPTLTLSKTTLTVSEVASSTAWTQITYDGDGDIYIGAINVPNATYQDSGCTFNFSEAQQQPALWVGRSGQATINPFTFKLMTTETATYKAASVTVTITA